MKWPWTKRERESEPTFDDPGKIDGFVNDADTVQAWRDYASEHGISLNDCGHQWVLDKRGLCAVVVCVDRMHAIAGFGADSKMYEAVVESDEVCVRLSRSPALYRHQAMAPKIEWIARRVREQLAAADAAHDR